MASDTPSAHGGTDEASDDIARSASLWFARNQESGRRDSDRAFSAWLAERPEHEQHYRLIEAMWGSDAFRASTSRALKRERGARRRGALLGLAGAALLVTGVMRFVGIEATWPADHSARIGERSTVTLGDGSRVEIDSASAVDEHFDADDRTLILRRGRIMVDVAADKRPFQVMAGDILIRDIGTRFVVERTADGAQVAVAEGAVVLRQTGKSGDGLILPAGQAGGILGDRVLNPRPLNPQLDFGWQRGRLFFVQRPLGDVVAELRRYHRGWIIVANDDIAKRPISGGFDVAQPAEVMAELARLSGGRLTRITDHLLILD